MTTKTDFTPEAWQVILAAPGAIGTLVMNASFGLGNASILAAGQTGVLPVLLAIVAVTEQTSG